MDNPTLTALSLFSGVGGLDLGLERALRRLGFNLDVAAYVEREAFPVAVLCERISEGRMPAAPIWTDVARFDARRFRGLVDIVAGGFPCQDLSLAGKRAGLDGERSGLWSEVVRCVRDVEPRWVVLENVPGLLSGTWSAVVVVGLLKILDLFSRTARERVESAIRARAPLGRVLSDLSALGFDAEWTSLRASEIGAPHRRERVFILAHARRGGDERRANAGSARGAESSRTDEAVQRERGRRAARVCGEDVGHVTRGGFGIGGDASLAGRSGHADSGHEHLADSGRERLEGLEQSGTAAMATGRSGRATVDRYAGLPAYPPGPDDAAGWAAVLERWPELAPAIAPVRGVADESGARLASARKWRIDALRAGGNGVVPEQACAAILELWERLT